MTAANLDTLDRRWGRWSVERTVAQIEHEDEAIVPPKPSEVFICPCCAADIGEAIWSAWWQGAMRWPYLCSTCAASWLQAGGRIALRWQR